jgi:hypothetical protein
MKNPYGWPFLKHRQVWIEKADKFYDVAAGGVESATAATSGSPLAYRKWRKAARYYERAAEYYRKAGLGFLAKSSYQHADACWCEVEDQEEAQRCRECCEQIEAYWWED